MNTPILYPTALVIDDEAFMRKLVATQLRSIGCKAVLCHESGESALATLEEGGHDIKLVVCDLQMPGMDGIEVLRRLGLMRYRDPLILVSGEDSVTLSMAEKLAQAHGLNLLGALRKPVQTDSLRQLLSKIPAEALSLAPPKVGLQVSADELLAGIQAGQLVNHYQPKVSTRTGRVVGMECLVRWQHSEHGLIYPDSFISVAEEHGLIDALTVAVLAGPGGALLQLKHWQDQGLDLHVAVNVSMDSLQNLEFPNVIAQLAQQAGVSLRHLVLEVTESKLNTNMKSVLDVLTRLRLKRLKLSIDDFGTGYSSLAQLHELPFDELKIDKQFVHGASQDHALDSILEASINMGSDLGMETTGEGVESVEDWLHLQRKGCDIAQGYWISRPMEAAFVPTWVAKWNSQLKDVPGLVDHAAMSE